MNFDSLDILLFAGRHFWFSWIIKLFTRSQWTHVGLVMSGKDLQLFSGEKCGCKFEEEKLYFWEAGREDKIRDLENNELKFGVQIDELDPILEQYDGKISWRKYKGHMSDEKRKILEIIHSKVHNKPYDANVWHMFCAWIGWEPKSERHRTSEFFCSAFVGYVLTQLDVMSKNINWDTLLPKYFDTEPLLDIFYEPSVPLKT